MLLELKNEVQSYEKSLKKCYGTNIITKIFDEKVAFF